MSERYRIESRDGRAVAVPIRGDGDPARALAERAVEISRQSGRSIGAALATIEREEPELYQSAARLGRTLDLSYDSATGRVLSATLVRTETHMSEETELVSAVQKVAAEKGLTFDAALTVVRATNPALFERATRIYATPPGARE